MHCACRACPLRTPEDLCPIWAPRSSPTMSRCQLLHSQEHFWPAACSEFVSRAPAGLHAFSKRCQRNTPWFPFLAVVRCEPVTCSRDETQHGARVFSRLAGTSNPEKNSTCSRRVRTNPATCCTVVSTSPLDSSWPSIGAAAGTTSAADSIWTCLHGARWVALDPDLSTIRLHPISRRYPSRQFTP